MIPPGAAKLAIPPLFAAALITGCGGIELADREFDRLEREAPQRPVKAARRSVELVAKPYLGASEAAPAPDRILPPTIAAKAFSLYSAVPLTLEQIARRITRGAGLPVRIARGKAPLTAPTAAATQDSSGQRFIGPNRARGGGANVPATPLLYKPSYSGALPGFLDQLSAALDFDWRYRRGALVFRLAYPTSYRVALPLTAYTIASGGTGAAEDSATASGLEIAGAAAIAPWRELAAGLALILPPDQFRLNPVAGMVRVVASPATHAEVAAYIEDFDQLYRRRIAIEITAFFIDVDKTDDYGLDLAAFAQEVLGGMEFSLELVAPTINTSNLASAAILQSAAGSLEHFRGSQALLRAVSRYYRIADKRSLATVTQHGTPVPFKLTTLQDIVRDVTVTVTAGTDITSQAVNSETLELGLNVQVLPRIVHGDRVHLNLSLVSSDLINLEAFETGENTVQLATIDQRRLQHDVVLRNGETLMLMGFEQNRVERDDIGAGGPGNWFLGGGKAAAMGKSRLLLLVTATLLDDVASANPAAHGS